MRALLGVLGLVLICSGCTPESEITGSTSVCAAKLYSSYNPKNLKQCVDVCIQCSRGNTTTCSTSCTLKGAV